MYRPLTTFLVLAMVLATSARAQFFDRLTNPRVNVTLEHPPGLGLMVDKIAFGPATGECADQIIEKLIAAFWAASIEVVDRQNLTAILAEHDFTFSGFVDQTSAAEIGKILGPSALIFVKELRCATTQDHLRDSETRYDRQSKRNYTVPVYVSRTRAFVKASLQTVDLETGRIFAAQVFDHSPEQTNRDYKGYPEAPVEYDVLDMAIQFIVRDVHRMFLPWSETTELVYFNDNTCNLKVAFNYLKGGDADGALNQSLANLEACRQDAKVKDKVLAHAFYNVAMSHMMKNEHDLAMEYFQEAAKLRPGGIVTEAMADCQRAKNLMTAMRQVEERAAIAEERREEQEERAAQAEAASELTNEDVITMVSSNLPESIIIHKILNSKRNFDTSAEALVALTNAGVSEQVIIAMMTQ